MCGTMCMCLYSYTQCAHVWVCVRLHVFIYVCAIPTTAGVGFFCCNFVYIYNFKYRHKVANRTSLRLGTLTSAIRYWLSASSLLRRSRSRRAIWIQYRWLRTYIIFHKNVKTSEQQNHDDWRFFLL